MTAPRTLYRRLLEPAARRLGLHGAVAWAYWRAQHALRSPVVAHEVAGTTARFRVSTVEETRRFRGLRDERPVIADLLGALEGEDVVFDVGANVGTYTCFLARRLPADRVVAFEPHPTNLAALRANLALNDVDATVVERALSDDAGTADLVVESHEAGAGEHALAAGGSRPETDGGDDAAGAGAGAGTATGTGAETVTGARTADPATGGGAPGPSRASGDGARDPGGVDAGAGTGTLTVDVVAGDELVAAGTVPAPTVLKVDVEGAELRVLEGLASAIAADRCRLVYVEVHPDRLPSYGDRAGDVAEFLRDRGFAVERLSERGAQYFLRGVAR